jgi:hypothetical protein
MILVDRVISGRRGIGAIVRGGAKSIALGAAALILAAQLLALAHFHQGNSPTRQFNAQAQVVADDGLCALCNLAFHAPFNSATTPSIARPHAELRLVDTASASLHVSNPFSSCQTRAPPAAIV